MLARCAALLAAAGLAAAADDNSFYNVFGTVAYIRTGERTPVLRDERPSLTALGANQMYDLGRNFRSRYISDVDGPRGLGTQMIDGMSLDILQNDQVYVLTRDEPYLVASAQAFMQGLYPPYSLNATRNGPLADATGLLANGSAIDFPLNGYQYPSIQAVSELDPYTIHVAGAKNCPESQLHSALYEVTDDFVNTAAASKTLYKSLDTNWFGGNIREWMLTYQYAYEIYDYLSYEYTHNSSVYSKLTNDSAYQGVYDQVRFLADKDAWYRYGNTSTSTADADLNAMAGKTLAAAMLGRFEAIVKANGSTASADAAPLSFIFGDHEPMVSFFSLAMLDYTTANFHGVPPFASAMILELHTLRRNNTFPASTADLMVRFSFHNGSDSYDGTAPTAFPMFGNPHSQIDMSWTDFENMMTRVMVTQLTDWCAQCSSGALFCSGVDGSGSISITVGGSSAKHALSPAVAGVIGAVVTLAVAALLFAAAMLLGGVRMHRVARGNKSALGGFKGSAKLASDADLHLPKNAAAPAKAGIVSIGGKDVGEGRKMGHERVGSWELRQKELGKETGDLGDETQSRRASFEAIEAAFTKPVEPSERV